MCVIDCIIYKYSTTYILELPKEFGEGIAQCVWRLDDSLRNSRMDHFRRDHEDRIQSNIEGLIPHTLAHLVRSS